MKTITINFLCSIAVILSLVLFVGCKDEEDIKLPPNTIQFESAQLGMSATETELTVKMKFDRKVLTDGTVTLSVSSDTLRYRLDFTTDPAMDTVTNKFVVPFSNDDPAASFKVFRVEKSAPRRDEVVKFRIDTVTVSTATIETIPIGTRRELALSLGEIVAEEGTMDPDVGGEKQPNIVFVDLSANRQEAVSRDAWDLGFYNEGEAFRVVLNPTSAMMARRLDKTDLTAVTAADTTGFGADLKMDAGTAFSRAGSDVEWTANAKNWIDDPDSTLSRTAIAEVSATDSENKVYIVNRGFKPDETARGWKKIRVLREGTGYKLQYADIGATTVEEKSISRGADYRFSYISFDDGPVMVEPKKEEWDIAFTVFSATADKILPGPTTPEVPYQVKDMVIQNQYGVATAQVLTSEAAYANFAKAGLDGITYETSQIAIGHKWRRGGGPTSDPALREDRFYVVKDAKGNVYKLLFTALTQNGERGRPKIEYKLVKKGS